MVTALDFAEVFTDAVRQMVPLLARRNRTFTFDCTGPAVQLRTDRLSLQCGLHRLLCALIDSLEQGFAILAAHADCLDTAQARLHITLAGAGVIAAPAAIDAVLRRLLLTDIPLTPRPVPGSRQAAGTCPNTGAHVEFASIPNEGLLINVNLVLPLAEPCAEPPPPHAKGARAWVINPDAAYSASLVRQLQRLGWAVSHHPSCLRARQHLARHAGESRPALVLVVDAGSSGGLEALSAQLPPWTQRVFAVRAGSKVLRWTDPVPGFGVRIYPFSPAELETFTRQVSPSAELGTGLTQPAPLRLEDRPLALVVDDDAVNRIVASGLVEALGFNVVSAADGLQAIEQCHRTPPDVVLMDIDMPGLNGIDTTHRLRELQRAGQLRPFAIVAATAGTALGSEAECVAAGMDGHLLKPLTLPVLQAEMRRLLTLGTGRL